MTQRFLSCPHCTWLVKSLIDIRTLPKYATHTPPYPSTTQPDFPSRPHLPLQSIDGEEVSLFILSKRRFVEH